MRMTADRNDLYLGSALYQAYPIADEFYAGALLGFSLKDGTVAPLGVRKDDVMIGLCMRPAQTGPSSETRILVGVGHVVRDVYVAGVVQGIDRDGSIPVYCETDNISDSTITPSGTQIGLLRRVVGVGKGDVLLTVGTGRVSDAERTARSLLRRWTGAREYEAMEREA